MRVYVSVCILCVLCYVCVCVCVVRSFCVAAVAHARVSVVGVWYCDICRSVVCVLCCVVLMRSSRSYSKHDSTLRVVLRVFPAKTTAVQHECPQEYTTAVQHECPQEYNKSTRAQEQHDNTQHKKHDSAGTY